ncbi:MAG TPA: pentapeptide repeat-containing protein, partial [Ktedonobacteraceae bacterium]|nr:pentapeptide repeat-containing protein [Ktedonobacteraceae bacterium]
WRTEPEIDEERQKYLTERRSTTPNIELGIYPFKDIKLSRADVEWLLATHENGCGPIDWNDVSQRERVGLDLRGADLSFANLRGLPLASTIGGLSQAEWVRTTPEQSSAAAVHLIRANLQEAHLEGANFRKAILEGAYFHKAYLKEADFRRAHLRGAYFREADLEGSDFRLAYLQEADFRNSHLQQTIFRGAHLEEADLRGAQLAQADLKGAVLDTVTKLEGVTFGNKEQGFALLAGLHWGDADLSEIDWTHIRYVGDEKEANRLRNPTGELKDSITTLNEYRKAVIANRRLAVALQSQGLNEDAARFRYRAQKLQQIVFRRQKNFGQSLFSLFLDLLAGYGYKPGRSFLAYILVISIFSAVYHLLGTHLAWNEAIVISMTAFHGRGFFPDQFHPGDPQALVAAIEAFVGLLIEVTFIATLTQRLFGK